MIEDNFCKESLHLKRSYHCILMQRTESFIKTIKRFIDNISKIKNGQALIKIKTGHGRFKQISVKIDKNF